MAGNETAPDSTKFVPDLFKAELKAGEWMYTSKLSVATFMRPGNPLDVRIQACLMLHSWGYSSDLAVFQKKGSFKDQKVILPLSPFGIAQILVKATIQHYEESAPQGTEKPGSKLSRHFMRKTLDRMDDNGIIDRCRANCPMEKLVGLSYREAREKGLVTPVRDLSAHAKKKLNRQLVVYLLAKPRAAKAYDAGEVVLKDHLGANPRLINTENRAVQLILPFVRDAELAAKLARREDVKREIAIFDAARDGFQAAKERWKLFCEGNLRPKPKAAAAPHTNQPSLFTAPVSVKSAPRMPVSDADVFTVLPVMRKFCHADADAARDLIRACRTLDPKATIVAIAEAVEVKGPLAKKPGVDNPVGHLVRSVPKMFEGGAPQKPEAAPESYWEQRAKREASNG